MSLVQVDQTEREMKNPARQSACAGFNIAFRHDLNFRVSPFPSFRYLIPVISVYSGM